MITTFVVECLVLLCLLDRIECVLHLAKQCAADLMISNGHWHLKIYASEKRIRTMNLDSIGGLSIIQGVMCNCSYKPCILRAWPWWKWRWWIALFRPRPGLPELAWQWKSRGCFSPDFFCALFGSISWIVFRSCRDISRPIFPPSSIGNAYFSSWTLAWSHSETEKVNTALRE